MMRIGLDGGMLFLDEVGELGPDEQAMLLQAVEEKKFLPVGADEEAQSSFQLICGSNRDFGTEVQRGNFRDLNGAIVRMATLASDRLEVASRRPVIKDFRRRDWRVAEIHINRMALAGAKPQAVRAELESLLVICRDHLVQLLRRDGSASVPAAFQKRYDIHPTSVIQRDTGGLWLMPQRQAEELADTRSFFVVHILFRSFSLAPGVAQVAWPGTLVECSKPTIGLARYRLSNLMPPDSQSHHVRSRKFMWDNMLAAS